VDKKNYDQKRPDNTVKPIFNFIKRFDHCHFTSSIFKRLCITEWITEKAKRKNGGENMTTKDERVETRDRTGVTWRDWLSWIGIIIALIGFFFWYPITLGIIGAILGIIAVWGTGKGWAWTSIVVGAIVFILGCFNYTMST
jgi:hypothetical protein